MSKSFRKEHTFFFAFVIFSSCGQHESYGKNDALQQHWDIGTSQALFEGSKVRRFDLTEMTGRKSILDSTNGRHN